VNGNWITVNGRLTIAFDNYGNKWIALEDPQMQNYRLSANLNRSAGQIEIAVRVQSSQSKLLVYNFGFYGHHCWAFDDGSYTNCIAGELGDLPEQMNIQMTVNGSNFSTLVDGRQTQSISMTDYSKGWIEIGIWCQNGFECPSIDNFKLDALP